MNRYDKLPGNLDALIFDFDGVILESLDVKADAFAALFQEYPEHVPAVVAFHREHPGLNRGHKFEWAFERIHGWRPTRVEMDRMDRCFAEAVQDGLRLCPLVPGVREFLQAYATRVPMAVASSAPHTEVMGVLHARGLADHFRLVQGHPPEKAEAVRHILETLGVHPEHTVLIGDARSDYEAAMANGLAFIGRRTGVEGQWAELQVPLINNLFGLENCLFQDAGWTISG